MGNSTSCWCCCCNCCKAKTLHEETENIQSEPISVITIQPTSSQNNKDIQKIAETNKILQISKNEILPNKNIENEQFNKRESSGIINIQEYSKQSLLLHRETKNTPKRSLRKKYNQITENFNKLKVLEISELQRIYDNSDLLRLLSIHFTRDQYFTNLTIPKNKVYSLERLNENSSEYDKISYLFTSSNKPFFKIQKIERIFNPYLLMQYNLKYLQYAANKKPVSEKMMFHGTSINCLDSICKNNFNWRLYGKKLGAKYGKGVYFASNAYFSTHYGDSGSNKIMFIVKVLVGKCSTGIPRYSVPPGEFDTTTDQSFNPQVYTKFDDNVFYPAYVVYYGGIDYTVKNRGRIRGRGRGRSRGIGRLRR